MTENHNEHIDNPWLNMTTAKVYWAEKLAGLVDQIAPENSSFWDLAKDVADARFEGGKNSCFSAQDHQMMQVLAPHVQATLLHDIEAMLTLYEKKFFDEDADIGTVLNLSRRVNSSMTFYQCFNSSV